MMKTLAGSTVFALLVAFPALGQDGSSQEKLCGLANLVCPKGGHCEGECRKMCDAAGQVLAAVRTRLHERLEKEYGALQACSCSKDASAAPCAVCDFVKTRVVVPVLKEKMAARMARGGTPVVHAIPGEAGKSDCSFPNGPACTGCVDELSGVLWDRMRMLLFDRMADFGGAVRAQVAIRMARAGAPTCECLKGPAPTRCSDPACESFKANVVHPLFQKKVEARLRAWDETLTHLQKVDGKEVSVPCTFLKGQVCWICADQAADQLIAKIAELKAQKQ